MKVNTVILDERMKKPENHPTYGTAGAAAFDLRAAIHEPLVIPPNGEAKIKTGIAMHLADHNLAGFILPRSGLGSKGLVLGNLVGLIDSDYQGELIVSAWNRSNSDFTIQPLERIAQMVILPVVQVEMNVVPSFDQSSDRGAGGFGSTGKN